jgi:hypothetical protein
VPRIRTLQTSFLTGQLDPDGAARSETALYKNGAARLLNCLPRASGGQLTRWGTAHVADLGPPVPVRLHEHSFNSAQSYIGVFRPGRADFYFSSDGAAAGSVTACPWSTDDMPDLKFAQSGDTMLVAHPRWHTQRIMRTGATTFVLGPLTYDGLRGTPLFRYAPGAVTAQARDSGARTIVLAAAPVFGVPADGYDITGFSNTGLPEMGG